MSDAPPIAEGSFRKIIPILHVRSPAASADWFHRTLGFKYHLNGEGMASILRGTHAEVNVYLLRAESPEVIQKGEVMIMVDLPLGSEEKDEEGQVVRALYDAVKEKEGVDFKEKFERKPWGYFQFSILDPDGHVLTFFQHGPDED